MAATASGPEGGVPGSPEHEVRRIGTSAAALVLFIALAVFHTWPLSSAPGTLSRHDNADAQLNEWAVAWVAHQVATDPLRLFDANIFHPVPNTLAFSEHMFLQAMMGAPLLWAGVSTLVVHNLLIVAGFALTGWAMALVVRRWTGDWWAAILAGMLLAFNAHSLSRIAHLQAVHVEFLPIAVYALDRLLSRPRVGHALVLSLAFVLQSLTSKYLLVAITFGLAGAALSRVRDWLGAGRLRVFALLCLSALIAVLLLVPFLLPYLKAHQEEGLTRSLDEVAVYSAAWQDYLSASGRLHYQVWSAPFWRWPGTALFPGITALVLVIVSLASRGALEKPKRMWLALGLTGLALSFGTSMPGYSMLYHAVPLLQGIRVAARFGYLVLAAVAALAGFGLAAARTRYADRPRVRVAISAAALLLVTAEAARLPVGYTPARHTPAVYGVLANEPGAVLVELPLFAPRAFFRNGDYMLHATRHWRPMLNGYSGFVPRQYAVHWEALRVFPDGSALEYLRSVGVTHVAVHARSFAAEQGEDRLRLIPQTPALRPFVYAGDLIIYRLEAGEP